MNVVTALDKVENEYSVLSKLGAHGNVVELLGVIDAPDSDDLYYVLEYIDGGVAMDYDKDTHSFKSSWTAGSLPESAVRQVAHGLASALAHAHALHIVHRDIKPDNVLISSKGLVKLADWGVAHDFESGALTGSLQQALAAVAAAAEVEGADLAAAEAAAVQTAASELKEADSSAPLSSTLRGTEGTFQFLSPEECSAPDFNGYKADVWSMGVTLWVLATGALPFGGQACNPMDLFEAIESEPLPTKPQSMSQDMYDFFVTVLCKDAALRPSASGVLALPWMQAAPGDTNHLQEWPQLAPATLPRFKSPKMAFLQLASAKLSVGSASPGRSEAASGGSRAAHSRASSTISERHMDKLAAAAAASGGRASGGGMSVPLTTPLQTGVWAKTLTRVLLRGWLFKRGRVRKTWKRRYFVLSVPQEDELFALGVTEPSLTYFKDNPEEDDRQQPKGCMPLTSCEGASVKPKPQKPLRFRVVAGGRQLFLQAGTEAAMQEWVKAINNVAKDHH